MLMLGCLRRELDVLSRVAEIDELIVVTPDQEVRRIAEATGARVLAEPGALGLNAALEFTAMKLGAPAGWEMMVLPADLPLLSLSAVQDLLALRCEGEPVITIAPDRQLSGTNALVCSLPAALPFSFGLNSFHRHIQAAHERGLRVRVLELAPLELDIDTPEDIAILRHIDPSLSERLLGQPDGISQIQACQLNDWE
jgi:2-phospho-L-lactate guanylyltransferase